MEPMATAPEEFIASVAGSQLRGWVSPFADERICFGTRPGSTRAGTEGSQDRVLSGRLADRLGDQADVFVICDGIGGLTDGGRCAELAISAFLVALAVRLGSGFGGPSPGAALREAVDVANRRLFREYAGRGGTTLSCVLAYRGEVLACSVGDTRIFAVDDVGPKQVSVDDTMRAALAASGQKDFESGPEHEKLIQFVGMGSDLQPHVVPIEARDLGRFVLVCTDGAYRMPSDAFARLTTRAKTPKQMVERLLAVSDWLGAVDDASAVVLSSKFLAERARAPRVARSPEGAVVLRVWGVGQAAMVLFSAREELGRRSYDMDARSPLAPPLSPIPAQQAARLDPVRPKKRRPRPKRHREEDKQSTLLRAHGTDVKANGDDVVIQVVAPSDRRDNPPEKQEPKPQDDGTEKAHTDEDRAEAQHGRSLDR
jgi:serine/threonine protein phosphatase PrpC